MLDAQTLNIAVAAIGVLISAIFSGIAIAVSFSTAKRYGDVAGTLAARRFEEEDARKARNLALKALLNEIGLVRKLAKSNTITETKFPAFRGVARIPVAPFETAFISGRPALDVRNQTLDAVTEYLSNAYYVNALIDIYLTTPLGAGSAAMSYARYILKRVEETCTALPDVLDRMKACIEQELGQ
jgi:hypothetical protein